VEIDILGPSKNVCAPADSAGCGMAVAGKLNHQLHHCPIKTFQQYGAASAHCRRTATSVSRRKELYYTTRLKHLAVPSSRSLCPSPRLSRILIFRNAICWSICFRKDRSRRRRPFGLTRKTRTSTSRPNHSYNGASDSPWAWIA